MIMVNFKKIKGIFDLSLRLNGLNDNHFDLGKFKKIKWIFDLSM